MDDQEGRDIDDQCVNPACDYDHFELVLRDASFLQVGVDDEVVTLERYRYQAKRWRGPPDPDEVPPREELAYVVASPPDWVRERIDEDVPRRHEHGDHHVCHSQVDQQQIHWCSQDAATEHYQANQRVAD